MDKNKKAFLGLLTALAVSGIDDDIFGDVKLKDFHKTGNTSLIDEQKNIIANFPVEPPIPKGCKEYAFDIHGEFSKDGYPKMLRVDVVFKCIAINDKSAIRKFKNRK